MCETIFGSNPRYSLSAGEEVLLQADRYVDSRDKSVANLARPLLPRFEKFFAFLRHDGVEPTNNVAGRALRCAAQWRKVTFGNRSVQGERSQWLARSQ